MACEYSTLAHALTEALVDMTWFIDGADDDQMDLDDAVKALEGVAAVLKHLTSDQRRDLLDVLGEMAEAEAEPARREFLEAFPQDFGLIDES
ncbi:hypothetical protein ACK389_35985 [Streptomyces antibioticus]|uniref:hypothetical protein n=1 Tax=Streptomyces antibioticus TaxID=1890 RepID=UPI000B24CDA0|nr:hypothetical protein [Streptomyces antibioticus]MCX5166429.1 hypothetical protein [Streptomyces antibioticus]MCX5173734.1 hypothetical protein [Streptomyces antibioticus]